MLWIALLGAIEFTDVLTTAMGHARGAIEAMPVSAAVIDAGGMMLFVAVKVALVVGVGCAVFTFTLSSVRVATVALAVVSLHNALLLTSLHV
jgi:hypothetical protein